MLTEFFKCLIRQSKILLAVLITLPVDYSSCITTAATPSIESYKYSRSEARNITNKQVIFEIKPTQQNRCKTKRFSVCEKELNLHALMAFKNDWDELEGDFEWEDSEVDSGYFDSDNEAGNPGS